ncbi:uncharacterized membrane protein YsdA (DUF1294 family) [Anaerosolibacter carboniphilus]|uniref:Uncharacterized membrane protein YsdA (DUF1294 family) n=1 Tax=Anaerosolibacter carboniphilus TaxID=1417629 RepID=A0A841KMR1_9FIRM|nr:DUF1294 domain-containing protein [Anaerosolibacter carboniphilus]MBB6214551.1 uncharacterized membrane protein YsdA (DUF1294 family) [Anaerosolibacter carboniphilus]
MKMIMNITTLYRVEMLFFMIYLTLVNGYGVIAMGLDKHYAKKHKRRISEKSFFITAALGGALGVLLGMKLFRHKTLHKSFTLGVPALFVLNMAVLITIYYYVFL